MTAYLDKNLKQIVIKSSKLVKEHGLNLAEYKRAIPTDGKWRAYAVALVVW